MDFHRQVRLGEERRALVAVLTDAVLGRGGLLVLTGDVGVGKTTLATAVVSALGARAIVGRVAHPDLTVPELYESLGHAFAIDAGTHDAFLDGLAGARRAAKASGAALLVLVDEAQRLAPDVRTELQHLTALGTAPDAAPLTVLLVAQESMPVLPGERRHRVRAMNTEEIGELLRWRLTFAGFDPGAVTESAVREIAALTGGIPRLVERVTDVAALSMRDNGVTVEADPATSPPRRLRRLPRRPVIVASVVVALALTSVAAVAFVTTRAHTPRDAVTSPRASPEVWPVVMAAPPAPTETPAPAAPASSPAAPNIAPRVTTKPPAARARRVGDEPDPGAAIDWLLNRNSAGRPRAP